jgi:hypothetical protein
MAASDRRRSCPLRFSADSLR